METTLTLITQEGLFLALTLYTSLWLGYRLPISNTTMRAGDQHLLMLCVGFWG